MTKHCGCGNPEGANKECERCRFIKTTAEVAALIVSLRADVLRLEWLITEVVESEIDFTSAGRYRSVRISESLWNTLCDARSVKRCSQCDGLLDEDGDGERCHLCCEYVSPEDQRKNDAMERGDELRDRAKDEKSERNR